MKDLKMLKLKNGQKRKVIDNIVKHTIDFYEKGEEREIIEILVVDNAKEGDKRRRFEITAKDYIKAERYAEDRGLALLGIYHSHPNHPSVPSEHDRISAQPFFSYLIISLTEEEINSIQSWLLNEDFQFEEEKILEHKPITH